METKNETYPSKVDAWVVIFMVAVLLGVLIPVGVISWQTGDYRPLIFVIVAEIFTCGLIALISCPLRYHLSPEKIIVQSGLMRTEVPVNKITGIKKTSNPLSAPAWSLKRLKIEYDNDGYPAYVVISPKDQDRFLKQLEQYRSSANG